MVFNLTGDQWLDPSTFRVMCQLNKTGNIGAAEGTSLKSIEQLSWNPAVFSRRARIICGGVGVEDIDSFNRLSLMATALKTRSKILLLEKGLVILMVNMQQSNKMIIVQLIAKKITTKLEWL